MSDKEDDAKYSLESKGNAAEETSKGKERNPKSFNQMESVFTEKTFKVNQKYYAKKNVKETVVKIRLLKMNFLRDKKEFRGRLSTMSNSKVH